MDATIKSFVEYLRVERGLSANTLSAYRSDLNQFRQYMVRARRGSWNVSPVFVRGYMNDLIQREYEASSQARKLAALKSLYRYLLNSGAVASDPTAGLDGARVKKRLPQTLSRAAGPSASCGRPPAIGRPNVCVTEPCSRRSTPPACALPRLAALDLADVDQAEEMITLARNGAGERRVPLGGRALSAVQDYLAAGRPGLKPHASEPALFLNHRGARLTRKASGSSSRPTPAGPTSKPTSRRTRCGIRLPRTSAGGRQRASSAAAAWARQSCHDPDLR